jgi:hypothetical protein
MSLGPLVTSFQVYGKRISKPVKVQEGDVFSEVLLNQDDNSLGIRAQLLKNQHYKSLTRAYPVPHVRDAEYHLRVPFFRSFLGKQKRTKQYICEVFQF